MIIQQIIDEQMKEFDKSIFHGPDFLNNFARKLIEAVGEEIINAHDKCGYVHDEAGPEYDLCESCSAIFSHKVEQRLKLKEIINSLK